MGGRRGCAHRPWEQPASFHDLVFSLSVSKKLAPIPPKVPFGQPGAVSDQSAGQPSPLSLSPTPPSTPSPYGLSYPQGYSLASGQLSPAAAAPPLASPSGFASTAAKSRPTPKPRQRPTLPPPQPPTVSLPAPSPQSTEHPVLDGMAPGESMSTGNRATAPPGFPTSLSWVCPVAGSLVPVSKSVFPGVAVLVPCILRRFCDHLGSAPPPHGRPVESSPGIQVLLQKDFSRDFSQWSARQCRVRILFLNLGVEHQVLWGGARCFGRGGGWVMTSGQLASRHW